VSTLSHRNHWTLRKDDNLACTCTPTNARHVNGWDCVTPEQLAAWRKTEPHYTGDKAKRLTWMWVQFSQDPAAKRLSGRVFA
jgi:hypothetical protein